MKSERDYGKKKQGIRTMYRRDSLLFVDHRNSTAKWKIYRKTNTKGTAKKLHNIYNIYRLKYNLKSMPFVFVYLCHLKKSCSHELESNYFPTLVYNPDELELNGNICEILVGFFPASFPLTLFIFCYVAVHCWNSVHICTRKQMPNSIILIQTVGLANEIK